MKRLNIEAKTLEEAKKEAIETFRVNEKFITFNVEEKKSLLGFKRTVNVEAVLDVDIVELGLKTLEDLFKNMGVDATIQVKTENNEVYYTIDTDENPVLIGKNGKTLESIQFYLRNLLNLFTEEHAMIVVDIGGYRANRKKQLEILATKTAKEVARTKVEVRLSPMNAYERRIIHTKLSEWRDVVTKSEGEAPRRYLVIRPKRK